MTPYGFPMEQVLQSTLLASIQRSPAPGSASARAPRIERLCLVVIGLDVMLAGMNGAVQSFAARYGAWAVVAGASEGLGAAFAVDLAGRGMNLVLIARRGEVMEEVAEKIRADQGVEVRCLARDLADPDTVGAVSEALDGQDLGVLVYNAASVPLGGFLDVGFEEIERAVAVNVRGPLAFAHALLPGMCGRGRGAVVLMSSLAGLQGMPGIATYAASKAFNIILGEGLWGELRERGVDVSVCCSGAVRTPGYTRFSDKDAPGMLSPEEMVRQTLDALGRGPRFVPGRTNRFTAQLMGRLLPRKTAIGLIARNTQRLS